MSYKTLYDDMVAKLEPGADYFSDVQHMTNLSIAFSMKRIADMIEGQVTSTTTGGYNLFDVMQKVMTESYKDGR